MIMNEPTLTEQATRAGKIASAALEYMPAFWARELTNQVLSWLAEDVTVEAVMVAIEHRVDKWSATCSDVRACAEAMVSAYRGDSKPRMIAAGKSGPAWGLGPGRWISANGRA